MPALAKVAREKLQQLAADKRHRVLKTSHREDGVHVVQDGKRFVSFSCNDYLGLSQHPQVKAASIKVIEQYGTGAGASRLVTGNHPLYEVLEARLAAWKGAEAALIYGSGYLANIGTLTALAGKDTLIIADKLVHACLIDGAQLSGAKLVRFKHNDMQDCARLLAAYRAEYPRCILVTEEVFSMDGDCAPLTELGKIASSHDAWLMVDGAHSFAPAHVLADIYVGTLSKALGSYGGYVCAASDVIDYLATTARSFMFSTALPPALVAAASAALDVLQTKPALAALPLARARLFTHTLGLPQAQSAIVPFVLGSEAKALAAMEALKEAGYLVAAIRPPTVPEGTSRLRFAFSALHAEEDVLRLARFIQSKNWL